MARRALYIDGKLYYATFEFSQKENYDEFNINVDNKHFGSITLYYDKIKDEIKIYLFVVTPSSRRISNYGIMKGIGKELLCYAIQYLKKYKSVTDETIISLDATSARKPTIELSIEEAKFIVSQYPLSIIDKYGSENITDIETIKLAREIKTNLQLVEYYKQYGFQITNQTYGLNILMEARVKTILSHCTTLCKNKVNSTDIVMIRDFEDEKAPIYCYTKEEFLNNSILPYINKKIENLDYYQKDFSNVIYLSLIKKEDSYYLS